eukprot:scpid99052/ scgid15798/ 
MDRFMELRDIPKPHLLPDEMLFTHMTREDRAAIQRAAELRTEMHKDKRLMRKVGFEEVHTHHLLAGAIPPKTNALFGKEVRKRPACKAASEEYKRKQGVRKLNYMMEVLAVMDKEEAERKRGLRLRERQKKRARAWHKYTKTPQIRRWASAGELPQDTSEGRGYASEDNMLRDGKKGTCRTDKWEDGTYPSSGTLTRRKKPAVVRTATGETSSSSEDEEGAANRTTLGRRPKSRPPPLGSLRKWTTLDNLSLREVSDADKSSSSSASSS